MAIKVAPGSEEVFVRIKPFNPQRKRLKKRYATFFGCNFYEERGWSRVPSKIIHGGKPFDVAGYLRSIRQNEQDPDSELVFDVCSTKEEARKIAAKETKEREERRTPDKAEMVGGVNNPMDMIVGSTTGDGDESEEVQEPAPKRGRRSAPAAQ